MKASNRKFIILQIGSKRPTKHKRLAKCVEQGDMFYLMKLNYWATPTSTITQASLDVVHPHIRLCSLACLFTTPTYTVYSIQCMKQNRNEMKLIPGLQLQDSVYLYITLFVYSVAAAVFAASCLFWHFVCNLSNYDNFSWGYRTARPVFIIVLSPKVSLELSLIRLYLFGE